MKWFFKCVRQYADFKGRASKTEFWMFVLVVFVVSLLIPSLGFLSVSGVAAIDAITGITLDPQRYTKGYMMFIIMDIIWILYVIIPFIAVAVRRLHDSGQSGNMLLAFFLGLVLTSIFFYSSLYSNNILLDAVAWLILFALTIALGWLFSMFLKKGDAGPNQYGSDPKALDEIALS